MAIQMAPPPTMPTIGVPGAKVLLEEGNGRPHYLARPCVATAARRASTIPSGIFARVVGV